MIAELQSEKSDLLVGERKEYADLALTRHPLSSGFKARLEDTLGLRPEYVIAAELSSSQPLTMIFKLRGYQPHRLLLPIEDAQANATLPILIGVAAVSGAKRIEIIHSDLRVEAVPHLQALKRMMALLRASTAGAISMYWLGRELRRLDGEELSQPDWPDSNSVLYLKAGLSLGLKAGGSITHTSGVVNGLVESGFQVTFASIDDHEMITPTAERYMMPFPGTCGIPFDVNYGLYHREVVRRLAPHLKQRKYAFIYQRMSPLNYSGVALSRLSGIPLVLEYNGSEAWVWEHWNNRRGLKRPVRLCERVCVRHASAIVTVSDVLKEELAGAGVAREKIVVCPNGFDSAVFDPERFSEVSRRSVRARHGIRNDAIVATFVGTFGQWHGAEVLARTIRHLSALDAAWLKNSRVHFLLVGDGLQMPMVREIISEAGLSSFVTLTGLIAQKEIPGYLAASDLFLSPHVPNPDGTEFFGSPTKLFEYMAMAKPIVASDLGQIGVILRNSIRAAALKDDGSALAVLTRPGDIDELAAAIKFLVANPKTRDMLGENARREVLNRYTWRHHIVGIQQHLSRLGYCPTGQTE